MSRTCVYSGARRNDNPPAPRHTPYEANLRLSVRHILASKVVSGVLGLAAVAAPVHGAPAQTTTSLQTDATVLPRHTVGVRVLTSFGRFDELLGNGGTRNLASDFNVDSLGGAQIAQLPFTQSAIRTLTGNNAFVIKAGGTSAIGNARVLTAPLMLEYSVNARLTLGIVVPLVETRTTLQAQLNRTLGNVNVGQNPGAQTWTTNATLVSSLRAAATTLQTKLNACTATPGGTGCAGILSQRSSIQSLIAQTSPFAAALENVYGTSETQPGSFFVPLQNSATQTAILDQIANFRSRYSTFGASVVDAAPAGAAGPAGYTALQSLLMQAGYDSVHSTDRSSIGDITVGATYQLANTFTDTTNFGRAYRVAVNAGYRIGTGEPGNRNRLFDNATGYGQPGLIVGAAGDWRSGQRFLLSAIGSYTKQLGSVQVERPANAGNNPFPLFGAVPADYSAGDVLQLTLMPRYRVAGLFSLDGIYSMVHTAGDTYTYAIPPVAPDPGALMGVGGFDTPPGAASSTAQQVGFAITYSTSFSDKGPGRIPYEASFRHIETLTASGGPTPKLVQDQIQLRVFFR